METDNNFYVATSGALPWREPDDAQAIEWSSRAYSSSRSSGRRALKHTRNRQVRTARRQQAYPSALIGRLTSTTTGVGDLAHAFPDSLENYRTYTERESTRHAPTPRVRT
eukprot:CAMPEP_0113250360 /NCGR_PEP_ID=MMETSP0008_2-20120614/11538_1 /TAXON_ID=97485 /ORGANISM="Prymnesium parvum" /LENGTH=109 /DNA_ID=CAMNT_0000098329 /DNA_START=192 /DNA_END=522 /DNA_ORIENTATION=+ /assembly_acc=CAM_ASM_000153